MIKALCFDMDGTLLNRAGKITDATKATLWECKRKGFKVFVATGRPPLLPLMLDLTKTEEELFADGGVYHNGGCLCYGNEKKYTCLSHEAAEAAIQLLNSFCQVNYIVQVMGELQSLRYPLKEHENKPWGIEPHRLVPLDDIDYARVIKIVAISPWNLMTEMYERLGSLIGDQTTLYLTGKDDYLNIDITDKSISKKNGVADLIDLCGIEPDEVAVFGDDTNDIEMLMGFPHSIAMGNACEKAKAVASHVTLSHEEDGIPHALKNILKIIE